MMSMILAFSSVVISSDGNVEQLPRVRGEGSLILSQLGGDASLFEHRLHHQAAEDLEQRNARAHHIVLTPCSTRFPTGGKDGNNVLGAGWLGDRLAGSQFFFLMSPVHKIKRPIIQTPL